MFARVLIAYDSALQVIKEERVSVDRLRGLERRWKETGEPEDEAAYLLERLRTGGLSRERLDLATYLGGVGARLALDGAGSTSSPEGDIRRWLQGAPRDQLRVLWRGALVALEITEGDCAHRLSSAFLERMPLEEIRAAARVWAQDPGANDERGRSAVSLIPLAYSLVGGAIPIVGEEALRAKLSSELSAWVLGDVDPLEASG